MKKVLIVIVSVLAAIGAGVSIIAARFEPTIVPRTFVGVVDVGGLSKEEAAKKIRIWWESQRIRKLTPTSSLFVKPLPSMTPSQLGIALDDLGSVADLPMTDLVQAVSEKVGGEPERKKFEVKFKPIPGALGPFKKKIKEAVGKNRPARVIFVKGAIVRQPEVSGFELDDKQLGEAVVAALDKDTFEVPLQEAAKTLPDEQLNKIVNVVSEFSTNFPSHQTSRNTNIRLAAEKLNGIVLMPGQQVSFNQTVGRRTVEGGFRTAPVLKNGKHDFDIGGGICQVSTTMYNAALFANLKVITRNNHSLPSAYVPLGRDATVDWGTLDLVLSNPLDQPIAISSTYQKGKLTFRVLGKKDPSIKVKVFTDHEDSWGRGEQTIIDRSLRPGTRRVIERGSSAHSCDTYRVVYKDGVEIKREHLNHSIYGGCPRIVAYNPAAPAAPKAVPITPVIPPPSGEGEVGF
jgi:vancomycin resistance protein YoaR